MSMRSSLGSRPRHCVPIRRSGKGMLTPVVLLLAIVAAYFAWQQLAGGRPPVEPDDYAALDVEVANVLRPLVAEVKADRASAEKHGSLGLAYEANKLWPEAARAFENAAALDASEPLWRYHQARALITSGDQERGYALLLDLAPRATDEPAVQLYYAHQQLDAGEYDEAQKALNHVVRLAPENAEGYAGQGELFVAREDYAGAISVLRRALDLDPGLAIAHYHLGLAYRGVGRMEEAEEELGIGVGARRQGIADRLEAEKRGYGVDFASVIGRSSDLIEAGEYKAAIESLERLRKTRPDDKTLLNNLGIAYLEEEQLDKALELFEHALEQDDQFFGTHQSLGKCYRELGQLEKALYHGEKAVELGGDVASAQLGLTRTLAQLGRFDDALEHALEAVRLDPEDATKHAAVGELLTALRRPREALAYHQKAIDLSPAFLPPRLNLIRILIGTGQLEQAEKVLREGEELHPDNPRIQECRRLYQEALRKRAAAAARRNG